MRNAIDLLSLEGCDRGVSPTWWQWGSYPERCRSKITVQHEGVDTGLIRRPQRRHLHAARRAHPVAGPGDRHLRRAQPRALPGLPHLHAGGGRDLPTPPARRGPDRRRRQGELRPPGAGGHLSQEGARRGRHRRLPRALPRQGLLRDLPAAALRLVGPRLPDLSLRAVLVGARGDGGRVPRDRIADRRRSRRFSSTAGTGFSSTSSTITPSPTGSSRRSSGPTASAICARPPAARVVERYDLHGVCLPKYLSLIRDVADGKAPSG